MLPLAAHQNVAAAHAPDAALALGVGGIVGPPTDPSPGAARNGKSPLLPPQPPAVGGKRKVGNEDERGGQCVRSRFNNNGVLLCTCDSKVEPRNMPNTVPCSRTTGHSEALLNCANVLYTPCLRLRVFFPNKNSELQTLKF